MTLMYDLVPEKRGLVRYPDMPVWHFPEDYVSRLMKSLEASNVIHPHQSSSDPVSN